EVGSGRKAGEEGRVEVTGMSRNRVVNSGFNRGKETGERKAGEEGRVEVTGMSRNRVVNSGFNRGKETGERFGSFTHLVPVVN
nr:hypothetical protein [Tanacetum cinerariifolium]